MKEKMARVNRHLYATRHGVAGNVYDVDDTWDAMDIVSAAYDKTAAGMAQMERVTRW